MKKLETFLRNKPSYTKCGNARIAEAIGISVNTIAKFKRTETFKTIKNEYLSK